MTKQPGLDLDALDTVQHATRGARIELKHPATKASLIKGGGIFIYAQGKDSEVFRDTLHKRHDDEALAEAAGIVTPTKTAAAKEEEAIELLTAMTIATGKPWESVYPAEKPGEDPIIKYTIPFKGAELEWTVENVRRFYREAPGFRGQLDVQLGNVSNFFKE